jgi:hypothetical protein
MDIPRAYNELNYTTTIAARRALGNGMARDEVADELYALADAIKDPGSVAENMSPIGPLQDDPTWEEVLNI